MSRLAAAATGITVGDVVRIKDSSRTGDVRYKGRAAFARNRVVVGLALHRKRSTSDCDGEYKGERHFTCTTGYGLYALIEDVRVAPLRPRRRAP